MSEQVDYTATRDYLYSLKNKGVKYGIDSILSIVADLKHPEKKFPCIHVAGTNGKGSVCAMIEAIYRANGYRTGLYTSPYLVHEREMIQVGRQSLSEIDIILYIKELKPIAAAIDAKDPGGHPSFFELMTVMAFLYFAKSKIDLAIVETGLGGRLDATNVVEPELSIITSIGLDHTDLLGDTIEKITHEKAGIIKPGKPVLIGRLREEAESIIRKCAEERNCKLYSVRDRFPDIGTLPKTNLIGSFQRWNAAVATYATEILNKQFPVDSVRTAPILKTIQWPARWQRLQVADRTVILDATHNPEGAEMLKRNLQALVEKNQRNPIIIAGTTGPTLRGQSLMSAVAHYARELHLVTPEQPHANSSRELETQLPEGHPIPLISHTKIETLFPASEQCTIGEPGDTIVVTGSIYLAGEVMKQLQHPVA